jgi:hypothetical protein
MTSACVVLCPVPSVEPTLATGADATSARLPPSSKCCVEDLAIQAAPLVFTLPRGVGLSFSQAFLAIALERRQPIFDDATPTGLDLNRHRHVGSEVEQLAIDPHPGAIERHPRRVKKLLAGGLASVRQRRGAAGVIHRPAHRTDRHTWPRICLTMLPQIWTVPQTLWHPFGAGPTCPDIPVLLRRRTGTHRPAFHQPCETTASPVRDRPGPVRRNRF